jgi:hypothetical protein
MIQFISYIFLTIVLFSANAVAFGIDPILSKCKPVNLVASKIKLPEIIGVSNNLSKEIGSFDQKNNLIIEGRLLDAKCVPVTDALIYFWQDDLYQKYHEKIIPIYTTDYDKILLDRKLSGTGTAITDNLGNFHIITLPPQKSSVYMNIYIKHPDFSESFAKILLPKNLVQNSSVAPVIDKNVFSGVFVQGRYMVDITLNEVNLYRHY